MKKQLLLLVSILLPLISSCNVGPTIEPTSGQTTDSATELTSISTTEPSEEIYYLDGLASNLFVDTFNKEFMNYYYVENHQSYNIKILDFSNEEISKLYIPNIINENEQTKRVKSFSIDCNLKIDELIIPEGIEYIAYYDNDNLYHQDFLSINFKKIYFPFSLKEIKAVVANPSIASDKEVYYNGTMQEFSKISIDRRAGYYPSAGYIDIICNDGVAKLEVFEPPYTEPDSSSFPVF